MQRNNPAKLIKRISSIRRYDPQPSVNAPHNEELLLLNQILRLKQATLETFNCSKFKKEMWDLRTLAEGIVQSTFRKLAEQGLEEMSHIVSAVIELYSTVMEILLQQIDRADKKEQKVYFGEQSKNRMCYICESSIEEGKLNVVRKYIDATWVNTLQTEVKQFQDEELNEDGDYDQEEYVKIVDKMLANRKAYSYKVSRTSNMLQEAVNIDIQKKLSHQAKISFSDSDVMSAKDAIDYALKMLGTEFKGEITTHMVPILQRLISKYMYFRHQKQEKMFKSIHVQTDKTDQLNQLKNVEDRAEMLHKKLYLKNLELEDLKKNYRNRDQIYETSMEPDNGELKRLEVQNGLLRQNNMIQQKSIRMLEQQVRKLERFVQNFKSVAVSGDLKPMKPKASKDFPEDNQSVQETNKMTIQNKPHRLDTNSSVQKQIIRTVTESSSRDPRSQKTIYQGHSNNGKRPSGFEPLENIYQPKQVTTKKASRNNNNSNFSREKLSEVGSLGVGESAHNRSSSSVEPSTKFDQNTIDLAKTVNTKEFQAILTTTTNLPKTKPLMMLKSKKTVVVADSSVVTQSNVKQNLRQSLQQGPVGTIDRTNISISDISKETNKPNGTITNKKARTQVQQFARTGMDVGCQNDSNTKIQTQIKHEATQNERDPSNNRQSYIDPNFKSILSRGVPVIYPPVVQSKGVGKKHQNQLMGIEKEQNVVEQKLKIKQQLLEPQNSDIHASIRSSSYEDFKSALCEQIGIPIYEVKQLQSSLLNSRLSRNVKNPGRLLEPSQNPSVNKTKQSRITLGTIHNSPMVSKRQSKTYKFFTTKDLNQMFGSVQQAFQFQSAKVEPKAKQDTILRTSIGQLYNHIDGMKRTDNNLYQWIKNFLKFPYQTAINNNSSSDLVSNFSQSMLETLFGRILTLHTKCDKRQEQPYCQHVKNFLGKIKFEQYTVVRQSSILPSIQSKK